MDPRDPYTDIRNGTPFAVRVTPNAGRDAVCFDAATGFAVRVTVPPEDGKANAAVARLVAREIGVPKSRLVLVRGGKGRDKLFRVDQDRSPGRSGRRR